MIRVFLVDDHAVLRAGLAAMLESTGEMTVIGQAGDGHEALNAEALATCDVLVLDVSLPRISGSEVLRRVRARRPALPVLVLSMYPEDQLGLQALRDGASAYLSKSRSPEELIGAIRRVARGGTYLTDTLVAQTTQAPRDREAAPHAQLSPREHQVFLLLLQGRAASDIAAELDLHSSTVSNNIRRIKEKLRVQTQGEIVAYAHRYGLIT